MTKSQKMQMEAVQTVQTEGGYLQRHDRQIQHLTWGCFCDGEGRTVTQDFAASTGKIGI